MGKNDNTKIIFTISISKKVFRNFHKPRVSKKSARTSYRREPKVFCEENVSWKEKENDFSYRGGFPIFCNHLFFCNHFEELQTVLFEV